VTENKGVKLHGGTLYINGNNVLWDTRQTDFRFTIGEAYMSKRPNPALHKVLSINENGVVELQRIGSNRKSHSMVQSFSGSYLIQEKKKHTLKRREAEKAEREAKRVEAAMQQMSLPTPVAPTGSEEKYDVQELGKDLSALIHDRMQALEDRLSASLQVYIDKMQVRLKEELGTQHDESCRELTKAATAAADRLLAQGKETEERLVATIIKELS